jgi:hypothetical protein
MPDSVKLAKAELRQLDAEYKHEINPEHNVKVQFNPETLKVTFANQIQTPQGAGDQRGTPTQQFVGAGTTKLVLQLWFDVNAPQEGEAVSDVRKMTEKISYFITPTEEPVGSKKYIPPAVRFIWGSFQFDGLMESLEESLEFFSPEGIPLRASMALGLSQQKIDKYKFIKDAPAKAPLPGTRPLTSAPKGSTVQGMAANQGKKDDWQSIAAANGVENPRQLQPGQLLDMNAKSGASGGISGVVSGGVSGSSVPLMNDTGVPMSSADILTDSSGQILFGAK